MAATGTSVSRLRRPWIAVALAYLACLALDAALSRHYGPNADLSQNYNELASIWRGNLLLDHWTLVSDNYVFTDLPFFILLRALFGYHLWLLTVEPVLVFAILLAGVMALVARAAPPGHGAAGAGAALYLVGLPMGVGMETFLQPDIHTATVTFIVMAMLAVQDVLMRRRQPAWGYAAFLAIATAAMASDPLADLLLALPLPLYLLLRLWLFRRICWDEVALLGLTFAAAALGSLIVGFIATHHGFTVVSATSGLFVTSEAQLLANVRAFGRCVQMLFQATPASIPRAALALPVAATRALAAAAVLLACLAVAWRMPKAPGQGLAQFCLLAAGIGAAADIATTTFNVAIWPPPLYPGACIRYVAPVFVLLLIAGLAGGLVLAPAIPARRRPWLTVLAAACAVLYAVGGVSRVAAVAAGPSGNATAPQRPVTDWLLAHHLERGVGDYWTTQMVMALTNSRILAAPVIKNGLGKLQPVIWVDDQSLFGRIGRPQFAVYAAGNSFGVDPAGTAATYGPIESLNTIGTYTVIVLRDQPGAAANARATSTESK